MLTLDDLLAGGVTGKKVFLRCDLNVPLDRSSGSAVITDDGRVQASLPTIKALLDGGAKVVAVRPPGPAQGRGQPRLLACPRRRAAR